MADIIELEILNREKMYPNAMLLDYLNGKNPMTSFIDRKPAKFQSINFTGDRGLLKEILTKYNKSIGAQAEVFENIESVENEKVKFVVTGQQPGFLTGPLYTIFKTLSAINYAKKFSDEKLRLIPLFWNASEDHDVEEVNNICVLNKQNEIIPFVVKDTIMTCKSLESYVLDKTQINDMLKEIVDILPETEFTDELYQGLIKEALNKSEKWGEFFSRLMSKLMNKWGLILVEPWIFRPYLKDYFTKLVTDSIKYNRIFLETTKKLTKIGYKPKMHKKENIVGLFYIDKQYCRNTISLNNNGIYEIANGTTLTKEEITNEIQSNPERFSTNAIFRPLAQDQMIPTHIFVGGPSEIGYHIQIKDLYKEFGLTQPNLQFRFGATVIERHINRIIEKYQFNVAELRDLNRLTSNLLKNENKDFLDKYFNQISGTLDELNENLSAFNQELGNRSQHRKQNIMKELSNIERMYIKYVKDDNKVLQNQLQKARAYLFPGDKPQERVFNIFQYLNKYSMNLLNCMQDYLTKVDPGNHVVMKCWMF